MNNSEFDFENTFPPLGHPEHHFNKYPEHPWLKNKKEIIKWVLDNNKDYLTKSDVYVYDDLTVQVRNKEINIVNYRDYEFLPVQFREMDEFFMMDSKYVSLVGTPNNCAYLNVNGSNIKSLKGLGSNVSVASLVGCLLKNFEGMVYNVSQLYLTNNPIESWKGFTKCDDLLWWQNNWCEKTSLNLLMDAPSSIQQIVLEEEFKSSKIERNDIKLDMDWLRIEQNKRRKIKEISNEINKNVDVRYCVDKRRKL